MKIWDLDGTVICSAHRRLADSQGNIDLDAWRANSTPEKIAQDSLLPLAKYLQADIALDQPAAICTARVLGEADLAYRARHGIKPSLILSRREGDTRPDAELKRDLIKKYVYPLTTISIIDDNPNVLAMAREEGWNAIDAVQVNQKLAAKGH